MMLVTCELPHTPGDLVLRGVCACVDVFRYCVLKMWRKGTQLAYLVWNSRVCRRIRVWCRTIWSWSRVTALIVCLIFRMWYLIPGFGGSISNHKVHMVLIVVHAVSSIYNVDVVLPRYLLPEAFRPLIMLPGLKECRRYPLMRPKWCFPTTW
jgi:hypothetical protein